MGLFLHAVVFPGGKEEKCRAALRHWLKDGEGARADLREVLDRGKLWTVDLAYLCRELKLPGF